jgi:hypothetical protein
MSAPSGHRLGDYRRVVDASGRVHFEATCGTDSTCGTVIRRLKLHQVWESHGEHLRHVRWLSRQRHPSAGSQP